MNAIKRRLATLARNRLAGIVVAGLLLVPVMWYGILPTLGTTRGDFANYFTAARIVGQDGPIERSWQDFIWFQQQMDENGVVNQVGGFIPHPPFAALFFLPAVSLDLATAKLLWTALNVLLLPICALILARLTRLPWLAAFILIICTGFGLLNNFLFGQLYLFLLATLLLGLYAAKSGRPVIAGTLIGSMIPIKYVGALFVLYFVWKRNWRLVGAATATVLLIALTTVAVMGIEPLRVFAAEVLPRHLIGEIQDPFAVQFQSWNSMFRRLFVAEPWLNPEPAIVAPLLFAIFSTVVPAALAIAGLSLLVRYRSGNRHHNELFEIGMLPLLFLLLSPGGATYHFLLLPISAAAFIRILFDDRKTLAALMLAGLLIAVNLPHFTKLVPHASGWTSIFAYPRLFLLMLFAGATLLFLRPQFSLRPGNRQFRLLLLTMTIALATSGFVRHGGRVASSEDGAYPLMIPGTLFARHLGLIVNHPAVGTDSLAFSYCELRDDRYTLISETGSRWVEPAGANHYRPALAKDDTSLVFETIVDGRRMVQNKSASIRVEGKLPAWVKAPDQFLYVRGGSVMLARLMADGTIESQRVYSAEPDFEILGLGFSEAKDMIAVVLKNRVWSRGAYVLRTVDVRSRRAGDILVSRNRIMTPSWSPDGDILLFSWRHHGNADVFAFRGADKTFHQLTKHNGEDLAPVWDPVRNRIVFVSDRNRGLQMTAPFALTIPPSLSETVSLVERGDQSKSREGDYR